MDMRTDESLTYPSIYVTQSLSVICIKNARRMCAGHTWVSDACVEYLKLLNTKKQRAGIVEGKFIRINRKRGWKFAILIRKRCWAAYRNVIYKKYNAIIELNEIY